MSKRLRGCGERILQARELHLLGAGCQMCRGSLALVPAHNALLILMLLHLYNRAARHCLSASNRCSILKYSTGYS
eukprot:13160341-Ditylum_brightwellii.AAC.1